MIFYDLVLLDVCHFHYPFLQRTFLEFHRDTLAYIVDLASDNSTNSPKIKSLLRQTGWPCPVWSVIDSDLSCETPYSGLGLETFVLVYDPTEHTTPACIQAKSDGKTRARVVCF